MAMALKDFWSKTGNWLRSNKLMRLRDYQPQIDDQGLITQDVEFTEKPDRHEKDENNEVMVKAVPPRNKSESLEKLQDGFNKLVEQLQGINTNLSRQVTQNEDLMNRIDQLPKLLESFPTVVENQKQLTEQLLEQLKATTVKNEQFLEAVDKIPTETAKQTDSLVGINHQLSAAADANAQMAETFNRFGQSMEKLDQTANSQTDSIMQMSKTFAASDRYLKYIMSRQHKRFVWIFIIAMGTCVLAILILTCIIIYLKQ
jgi:chromosome segregation ATPase